MFDISFAELIVVAMVALLVIGPEKLPKVARTLGALTGRLQRYMAQVKDEVNREVRFEELQKLQQEIKQTAQQVTAGVTEAERSLNNELQQITDSPIKKSASKSQTNKPNINKKSSSRKTEARG
ncbi:MAG: Sec-independent protein translocase protein TatB [Methylophilaceae bacterium]